MLPQTLQSITLTSGCTIMYLYPSYTCTRICQTADYEMYCFDLCTGVFNAAKPSSLFYSINLSSATSINGVHDDVGTPAANTFMDCFNCRKLSPKCITKVCCFFFVCIIIWLTLILWLQCFLKSSVHPGLYHIACLFRDESFSSSALYSMCPVHIPWGSTWPQDQVRWFITNNLIM